MEGFTFQPNMLDQQQQLQSNMLVQQQAATPTISSLQEHVIEKKKKNRHSAEFKAKILSQLETSSQADLARLYKIDRRLIGKW